MVAVLVRVPVVATDGRMTTVMLALAPTFSVPRLHVRVTLGPAVTPPGVQVPCVGTADWNPPAPTRLLSVSVTTTLVALPGPALLTLMT